MHTNRFQLLPESIDMKSPKPGTLCQAVCTAKFAMWHKTLPGKEEVVSPVVIEPGDILMFLGHSTDQRKLCAKCYDFLYNEKIINNRYHAVEIFDHYLKVLS